jgi:putative redox protein
LKRSRLHIPNSKGYELNAYLELPANQKPEHFALFAHCFTCSSSLAPVRNISRELTNHGIGVLRFDFTGLGQSEGSFSESHFSANVQDLIDVHQFMTEHYEAPELFIGHSLGGAAVLVAASKLESVKAVATIGAPAHIDHVKQHFSHGIDELEKKGEVEVDIGGRPFKINQEFVEEFNKTDLLEIVQKLKKPLLILHSPFDKIVGIENANELFHSAFHPKSFVSLDRSDHLLSKKRDSVYVGEVIGAWVKRFFDEEQHELLDPKGEQVIGHLDLEEYAFTTRIQMKKHSLVADEPEYVGGDDFGPSPYELLNSSLAACTAMTLKMYANRKKWDLREIFVYVSHSKKHHTDISDMDNGKKNRIDHFSIKLELIGDLNKDQKARLLEISERCPVHRTLEDEVAFDSALIETK